MSVLVVGSVALDSIQTPVKEVEDVLGGSASYFSCAAIHYTQVNLVAVVGTDFPSEHLDFFKRNNIDTQGLQIQEGKTFRWKGHYEDDFNTRSTIYTHLNVFETFHPGIPEIYKSSEYVFLANIDPELQMDVLKQVKKPKLVVCDTMDLWIMTKKEALLSLLKKVDILLINDSEARQLTQQISLPKAARIILSWGVNTVVIKKGEHGALLWKDKVHFSVPGYPLEDITDPTGAGDTFAGGLVGYLAHSDDLSEDNIRKAMIYGSVMASYSVEDFSPHRLARVTEDEVKQRYKDFIRITHFET